MRDSPQLLGSPVPRRPTGSSACAATYRKPRSCVQSNGPLGGWNRFPRTSAGHKGDLRPLNRVGASALIRQGGRVEHDGWRIRPLASGDVRTLLLAAAVTLLLAAGCGG